MFSLTCDNVRVCQIFCLSTARNVMTVTKPGAWRPEAVHHETHWRFILETLSLSEWSCVNVPQDKRPTPPTPEREVWRYFDCMHFSILSHRQTPNQSRSPLSAEPAVIPQIKSWITSEKIKIFQFILKSGSEQRGWWMDHSAEWEMRKNTLLFSLQCPPKTNGWKTL